MAKVNYKERKELEEKIEELCFLTWNLDGDPITIEKNRPYKGHKVIEIKGHNDRQIKLVKVARGRWGELDFQRPSRGFKGTTTESFLKGFFDGISSLL